MPHPRTGRNGANVSSGADNQIFDIEVIRDVMSSKGFKVDIDHSMIEAGVEIRLHGAEVLELLLSQMSTQVEITGKTVAIALRCDNASH